MSRLEELIQELCPDGVEYRTLGEIASYAAERISATELTSDNYVGVDNLLQNKQGKTQSNYVPKDGSFVHYVKNDILIGNIRPYLKKIWLSDCEGGTNGDVLVIHVNSSEPISSKFLYYLLSSDDFFLYDMQNSKGSKMPRGNKAAVMKYHVPVPPLEIQREIVRILDNFTELTAELTAELAARKQQYEYYRDQVLTPKHFELKAIKDIADTNIGLATTVTKYKTNKGVLLIHNSDIQENQIVLKSHEYISEDFAEKNKKKKLKKDDIVTVHTGDVGTSAVVTDKYDGAIGFTTITSRIKDKSKIDPQYLCHYLNSHRCKQDIARMTISDRNNLNQKNFDKIMIPVPPMEVQRGIVEALDSFEAICSDLSNGLPAEIEARQKQYEYYRDKLLTFKEKSA